MRRERYTGFSVVELLRRLVFEHYGDRQPGVIYAHMLEQPIHEALRHRSIDSVNGFMVVGELIHRGLAEIIGHCREYRRVILLDEREIGGALDKARRFIHRGSNGYYVVLAGSPDACISTPDGLVPIELKTTRSNNVRLYWKWRHRIKIYNFLMDAPYGYVVVINVNDATEKIFLVDEKPNMDEMRRIILDWMKARYPTWALDKKLEHNQYRGGKR